MNFSRLPRTLMLAALMALPAAQAQQMPGAPGQPDMRIDAGQRQQVLDGVIGQVNKSYIFPETAKKIEAALREHDKRGAYSGIDSAEKLAATMNEHLQAVSRDKHLHLFYSARAMPEQSGAPDPQERAAELAGMKVQNYGVYGAERLPFNIGYLNLSAFAPTEQAADTIGAAMTLLANTDSLIIDLRNNGGGEPETVALLASYFLDGRVHLSDIYTRPTDTTQQIWTTDKLRGKHYGSKKDVYILTSAHTFSAAEDFSYALVNLKRATVVGETTGGGAHPSDIKRLNAHFALSVPTGRTINQVTKSNWEGTGVAPQIAVKADDAYKTAQTAILKKLAAIEQNPAKLGRIKARIAAVEAGEMKR